MISEAQIEEPGGERRQDSTREPRLAPPPAGTVNGSGAERERSWSREQKRTLPRPDDPIASELCPRIRAIWQQRQDLLRAEKRLENQCRAILIRYFSAHVEYTGHEPPKEVKDRAAATLKLHRRKRPPALSGEDAAHFATTGSLLAPFLAALGPIQAALAEREQELESLAAELPLADWIAETPGFALMSLAGIVGFAGDLSRFPTPGKLEVMMSIGFVGGERQRRVAKDSERAVAMRFAPERRAFLYTLAKGAMMNRSEPWRSIYDQRKTLEETTRPDASKGHRDNSALRVTARHMLRAVWREWRRVRGMYHWPEPSG
jgi:hypothetical protein